MDGTQCRKIKGTGDVGFHPPPILQHVTQLVSTCTVPPKAEISSKVLVVETIIAEQRCLGQLHACKLYC